ADRTAGTGYHHRLSTDAPLKQRPVRWYRVTPKQVSHVHFLQVIHLHLATGQIHDPGNGPHMHTVPLQSRQNLLAAGSGGRRHSQKDFRHTGVDNHATDLVTGVHLQAGNGTLYQIRLVIDKGHRLVQPPHFQRRQQLQPGSPGPVDSHWLTTYLTVLALVQYRQPGGQPVTHEVLTGHQAQPANQQQTQRPKGEV